MALRYVLLLTSVASFAAGSGREEPHPENSRDPKAKQEGLAKSRGEVRELRATQKQMRADLARILAEKKAQKAKLEQKDEEDTAAGALAKAKAPLKAKPKVKQLAKVVGGKQNPHDVRAATSGDEGAQIPESIYFEALEAWLNQYPHAEKFHGAPLEFKDVGAQSVRDVDFTKDESVQAALTKVGSQPNVGYFIEQSPELRRKGLLDHAYPINEDNVRSWKRIAVYEPYAEVRLAAAQRLQQARMHRVKEMLSGLKPAERVYFSKRDPLEDITAPMLRILAQGPYNVNVKMPAPEGNGYVVVVMPFPTQGMVDTAKRILAEFGERGTDVDSIVKDVDAAEAVQTARTERLSKPVELTADDRVEVDANAEPDYVEERPAPKAHLNVLYSPEQAPMEQMTALTDRSVPANRANWHSWLEIYFSSAPEAIRRAALLRAIEASPAYAVTKNYPEMYQSAFVEYDPRHVASDFRALSALARGETHMRLNGAKEADVAKIALQIIELNPEPDLANGLEDRFWKKLLYAGAGERFMRQFDHLDFSSDQKLAEGLQDLANKGGDDEAKQWAPYLLHAVATPPPAGSAQALVLKHLETLEPQYRGVMSKYLFDFENETQLRQGVNAALERRYTLGPAMTKMLEVLHEDLEYRKAHAGENLDVVTAAEAQPSKLQGEAEAFDEIGYDPNASLESRAAAVGSHEVLPLDVIAKGALAKWLKIADFDRSDIVRDVARAKIWAYEKEAVLRFMVEVKSQYSYRHGNALEGLLYESPRDPATHAALKAYRGELGSGDVDQRLAFAIDQILIAYPAYVTP